MDEETKKMYAMSATLRRLCCPKPSSGKLEVSQEVYKQWKAGGDQRKALLKVKEYWVDVETTGSFEAEEAEELNDHTVGEGDAGDSFTLGLPASQVLVDRQGDEPEDVTDLDVSEDDGAGCRECGTCHGERLEGQLQAGHCPTLLKPVKEAKGVEPAAAPKAKAKAKAKAQTKASARKSKRKTADHDDGDDEDVGDQPEDGEQPPKPERKKKAKSAKKK
eukprot:s99_g24.t1